MVDVMPPAIKIWQNIENTAREVFGTYGYSEIRTPILEDTSLFKRGVGESTSVVEKEMYSFTDQGDHDLSLRPEGTASVVRAYIESGMCNIDPLARYYYMGPMFRRERPQKGRQRQFYQIGCELLAAESPYADAEVISMAEHFLKRAGVSDLSLEINSIGCEACRPSFNSALVEYFVKFQGGLCDDCIRRLSKNPLRILDCKNNSCKEIVEKAPRFSAFWCDACVTHFSAVKQTLDGIGVSYVVNEQVVRGLDYYMRTAFEFTTTKLGAQNAVLAGGRYDGLVRGLGGPDVAGIGFAMGMERLVLLLQDSTKKDPVDDVVYFAVIGELAGRKALPVINLLRRDGIRVEWDYAAKSLKSQMRKAGKIEAGSVVIMGDDEITRGEVIVKNMKTGEQQNVRIKDLPFHFINIGG